MDSIKKMTQDIEDKVLFAFIERCNSQNRPVTYVGLLYWVSLFHEYRNTLTIADIKKIHARALQILPNEINNPFIL